MAIKKARAFKKHHYRDDTSSTDAGNGSNIDFSDKGDLTDGRFTPAWSPGVSAPPGLEAFGQQTCFNSSAPCFVPGASMLGLSNELPTNPQQLRRSIGMLKGALQEWEANLPVEPASQQVNANGLGETNSLLALQQALSNLTPTDTAALRSFLDSRVASHNTAPMNTAVQQPKRIGAIPGTFPSGSAKWGPPQSAPQQHCTRSFTPFQGKPAPWDHGRTPKAPWNSGIPKAAVVTDDSEESLRTHLRDLALLDNAKVLMLRRVNRLGINSQGTLKEYFSKFGSVARVMVAPTRSKPADRFGPAKTRVRAGPLGFAVMSTASEANAALAAGSEQIVQGESIEVSPFESHTLEGQK